jgi:chitinase
MLIACLGVAVSAARAELWTTAYYAAWMQDYMPASQVDFSAVTHVIHFAVVPNADGTLDPDENVVTVPNSADVVARGHAADKKVLISVGGAGSVNGFRGATSSTNLSKLVTNIANFMTGRGYDGVDIDWEPLQSSDATQYSNLVTRLRSALDAITPRPLLTAVVAEQPALLASLQSHFDQINLMTYDLSGPWPGWVTWFNSPIYDGGFRFPSTGGLVPSINGMVNDFIAHGVAASKLGARMDFYGYIWSGGSGTSTGGASLPRQSWSSAPSVTTAAYYAIMANYFQPQRYFWDTAAQAACLSIDNTGSANDKFISFDDPTACQMKVRYAKNKGIGGVMIWELGGGYRPDQPAGRRDPLLQAVKRALTTPQLASIQLGNNDVRLSFTTIQDGHYRVEFSSNPVGTSWSAFTNDLVGNGGVIQFTNLGGAGQSKRFYRIKTPPLAAAAFAVAKGALCNSVAWDSAQIHPAEFSQ